MATFKLPKQKKRLSEHEEFEIMKIVLDKFLWLGTALMGFGLYTAITGTFLDGVYSIATGAVLMLLFAWLIIREFKLIR